MTEVVLSIGSNYGERARNVEKALEWLRNLFSTFNSSDIYETPEIYGRGNPYCNCVVKGLTDYSIDDLETYCKRYEINCGRDADARKRGEVIIDIDIVISDGVNIRPIDYSREFFQIGYRQI